MLKDLNLKKEKADVRRLKDLAAVVYDRQWYAVADKEMPLYWMWRGLKEADGLRYDILQFAEGSLGQELPKTAGHKHSLADDDLSYPELYQVLAGEVIYLLQRKTGTNLGKVVAMPCQAGDFCLVPPNFEHITINLAGEKTFMANWTASANRPDYSDVKLKHGGAYFGLKGSPVSWEKNSNYGEVPPLQFLPPTDLAALGIDIKKDALYNLEHHAAVLNFIKEPQNHNDLWASLF